MNLAAQALTRLLQQAAVWVTVDATQGSVPRDTGAWMAVFADSEVGTIGGGRVEFEALDEARRRLAGAAGALVLRYPLGPGLGQCCGGVMHLRFEQVQAADVPALRARLAGHRMPVALFGGGHVGRALVDVLGRLPFAVNWIDSRDEVFPVQVPDNVVCEHSDPVHLAVASLVARSAAAASAMRAIKAARPGASSRPSSMRRLIASAISSTGSPKGSVAAASRASRSRARRSCRMSLAGFAME